MRVNGYWVYLHRTPDGMVYVGRSGRYDTNRRWHPLLYKRNSLWEYIEKYGWDNIQHELVKDRLTKEESFKLESELIRKYKEDGICINKNGSGGLQCDGEKKKYDHQYYLDHREELRENSRRYRETHREAYNAKARARYAANREQINAKARARRAAKKKQKDQC